MKTKTMRSSNCWLWSLASVVVILGGTLVTRGQGAITFNSASLFSGTDYYEMGMWFHTVIPPGEYYHDGMAGSPSINGPSNVPYNDTPYMVFFRQNSPGDYVTFSLTSGNSFGLTSVALADPHSPSSTLLPITFIGTKADNSQVSMTFTTPGGGATTFQTYYFGSAFASGLTSVQIQSTGWAMDNLVVVPEPGTASLALLGLLAGWRTLRGRREGRKTCVN